jgi:hypothetical protein
VETLLEIGGACAGLQVAWSYATGGPGLTVDQAAALVVAAVIAGRVSVQAARRFWQHHYRQLPSQEFPPDRLGTFFLSNIISDHLTLPH